MKPNFIKQSLRTLAISSLFIPVVMPALVVSQANAETQTKVINNAVDIASEAKANLMAKLSKIAYFSANFTQKILNENGDVLQEGAGELAISKPNLVNWKTTSPDETLIVSDGETLWFYDPFIEQASAYSLTDSINNTPILLITSDDAKLWQQYTVIENGLAFDVIPKEATSQIKKLTLEFVETTKNNVNTPELAAFSFQDATGQISRITLSDFSSKNKPSSRLFTFTLPEGVRLEDKR